MPLMISDDSSSIFKIVFQLLLCGLFIYLIRLLVLLCQHGNIVLGESETNNNNIPKIKMNVITIPFSIKLLDNPHTAYGEIGCKVASDIKYRFFIYWGVSNIELSSLLGCNWYQLSERSRCGKLFESNYKATGTHYRAKKHTEKVIRLKQPLQPLELGNPPRFSYPLVICMMTDEVGEKYPEETVALISIIHLKDRQCPLPTSILAQYLKQYNGNVSCLQPLYLTTCNNPDAYEEVEQFVCVVCQHYPISRVLLPCRHTCICAFCFLRIQICPICRCPISSYFCIRSEEYTKEDENTQTNRNALSEMAASLFQNLNL